MLDTAVVLWALGGGLLVSLCVAITWRSRAGGVVYRGAVELPLRIVSPK